MNQVKAFYQNIVVPTYHVLFVASIFVAIVSSLIFSIWPVLLQTFDALYRVVTGAEIAPRLQIFSLEARLQASVSFAIAFGLLVWIILHYLAKQRRALHIMAEIRRCLEAHLTFCSAIGALRGDKDITRDAKQQRMSELAREHNIYLCSRISEIFEMWTRHKCHTSLKSFNPTNGGITRRARDVLMHNGDRCRADEEFPTFNYKDNTAFDQIFSNTKQSLFIGNYLRLCAVFGVYKNKNMEWKSYYSATVVAPITSRQNPAEINERTVIGFLCVDSKCGRFGRNSSKAILSLFVAMFYNSMIDLRLENSEGGGGDHVVTSKAS